LLKRNTYHPPTDPLGGGSAPAAEAKH
jgi:hypothetical protein